MTDLSDEAIYRAYPRHMAPRDAKRAIQKAVKDLARLMGETLARETLMAATIAYAASPQGRRPDRDKIPYPATWYNRQSYLEDRKEWNHVGGSNGAHHSKNKYEIFAEGNS